MKSERFLFVLFGICIGFAGTVVTLNRSLPEPKVAPARQFVVVVTPNGAVFGEAKPNDDVVKALHETFSSPVPAEKPKINVTPKGENTF